jgi:hypothetical protein
MSILSNAANADGKVGLHKCVTDMRGMAIAPNPMTLNHPETGKILTGTERIYVAPSKRKLLIPVERQ